jgi:hypothetical protein
MSLEPVRIRELAGWGFDRYEYRPAAVEHAKVSRAAQIIAQRSTFEQSNAFLTPETEQLKELLKPHAERRDLVSEMYGLSWSLGVVDLRCLVAFQRRLAFSPEIDRPSVPNPRDWPALIALSFASPRPVEYEITHDRASQSVVLRSGNPNLHLRITNDFISPLSVHAGCPFFEVGCFRNRWFLRDGYHRAYALLQARVFEVPAVIVQAATIEDLGVDQSWFFSEEILLSEAPPRVVDFLNEDLVLEYNRPALIKALRIQVEETFTPATLTGE